MERNTVSQDHFKQPEIVSLQNSNGEVVNIRKSSESTQQLQAQQINEGEDYEQDEEQGDAHHEYDEQTYKSLNSGVYQCKAMNEEQEEDVENDPQPVFVKEQSQISEGNICKTFSEEIVEQANYEEQIKQGSADQEEIPEKAANQVLQPELQQVHAGEHEDYIYPSLMEEEIVDEQEEKKEEEEQVDFYKEEALNIKVDPEIVQPRSINLVTVFQKEQKESQKQPLISRMEPIKEQISPKSEVCKPSIKKEKFILQEENADRKYGINIFGYEKTYFLKMETQIYQIEVTTRTKTYVIKRRFSEFAQLDRMIKLQNPGYIIYPFPQKSLELLKKLKFSIGGETDKVQTIEKRLLQLEKYLQFLINHPQISNSPLVGLFLLEDYNDYSRRIVQLQNLINEQEKQYQLDVIKQKYNNIKSMVKIGFGYFQSYLSPASQRNQQNAVLIKALEGQSKQLQQKYISIKGELQNCQQKANHFYIRCENLKQIYKNSMSINNIESSIDSILTISSKLSSSKSYYEKMYDWVQDNILAKLKYYLNLFEQIKEQIAYRSALLLNVGSLEAEQVEKGKKILRKVAIFDQHFLADWKEASLGYEKEETRLYEEFNVYWKEHCSLMSKIWR